MTFTVITTIVLFILCGLMTAAERAIHEVDRQDIRDLAEEGAEKGKRALKLFEESHNLVATALLMQVVFTIAITIMLSWSLLPSLTAFFYAKSLDWGLAMRYPDLLIAFASIVFIILVAIVSLVFIIFLPRQIAMQHKQGTTLNLSGYAIFWIGLFRPFRFLIVQITNLILVILRQEKGNYTEAFSLESIMSMLEVGQERGEIKEEGKKMINSIFAFDDKLAYEIMTPRTNVFMVDVQDEPKVYLDELMELRFSRIPVCDVDSDNIIGILNIKDYLIKAREAGFDKVDIPSILREPYFVPETKNIDSLFFELQKEKQHIAILIDEYGGFSGIVTMEDIIEEVMGDIDDEYDEEEIEIEKLGPDRFLIAGTTDLDDINEELGTDFESDSSETIGGFLIDMMGEIPEDSDDSPSTNIILNYENYLFTIESIRDRRIEKVELKILEKKKDEEDGGRESDGK